MRRCLVLLGMVAALLLLSLPAYAQVAGYGPDGGDEEPGEQPREVPPAGPSRPGATTPLGDTPIADTGIAVAAGAIAATALVGAGVGLVFVTRNRSQRRRATTG
jgi:hypothetical protein